MTSLGDPDFAVTSAQRQKADAQQPQQEAPPAQSPPCEGNERSRFKNHLTNTVSIPGKTVL